MLGASTSMLGTVFQIAYKTGLVLYIGYSFGRQLSVYSPVVLGSFISSCFYHQHLVCFGLYNLCLYLVLFLSNLLGKRKGNFRCIMEVS